LCKCSFCGKGQSQVKKLVAGPGVYICEQCIGICCELMEVEGVPIPGRRSDETDPGTFLRSWIGRIDPADVDEVIKAKDMLIAPLMQLHRWESSIT
jgi:hypothetical protein